MIILLMADLMLLMMTAMAMNMRMATTSDDVCDMIFGCTCDRCAVAMKGL